MQRFAQNKEQGIARHETMTTPSSTLRPHGGYRNLRSFQVTEIIYDGTVSFCDRFVGKRSRTHDQMVQAARSGRHLCPLIHPYPATTL